MNRLKIGIIILTLLFPLFLFGCDDEFVQSEDRWPTIVNWDVTSNLTVKLDILEGFGIPRLEVANRTIGMTVDVKSYHVSQEWTIYAFLESVTKQVSLYSNNLPGASVNQTLPVTEIFHFKNVTGTYLGGTPPGGTVQFALTMEPEWFPLSVSDWVSYEIDEEAGLIINSVTDRYIYNFRLVVEDLDGRSDTTTFAAVSPLEVSDDD